MDGQTERCAHCGTPSTDGGRFCINCGAELGTEPTNPRIFPSATDTAERVYDVPAPLYAAPSVSPGPVAPPPGSRPAPEPDAPRAEPPTSPAPDPVRACGSASRP